MNKFQSTLVSLSNQHNKYPTQDCCSWPQKTSSLILSWYSLIMWLHFWCFLIFQSIRSLKGMILYGPVWDFYSHIILAILLESSSVIIGKILTHFHLFICLFQEPILLLLYHCLPPICLMMICLLITIFIPILYSFCSH